MKVYAVGGAVRDTLLGRKVKDLDWVVVGATADKFLEGGNFKQVGADFPVFLNSKTGEEYALARTERKTGKGYHGFETNSDSSVTLEDDLFRRDLTINAMAVDKKNWTEFQETKNLDLVIDPYGGLEDLKNRVLRHVSEAFADDPVRVLRIARFRARYFAEFQFTIAPETMEFILQMANDGEVKNLVPERIWAETEKALMENTPAAFFDTLIMNGSVLLGSLPVFFGNVGDTLPLQAAAVRQLSLSHRLMVLTYSMEFDSLEENMRSMKVPVDLIKRCLRFNKLTTVLRDFDKLAWLVDGDDVFELLGELDVWSHVNEFRDMGIPLAMIFDYEFHEVNRLFDILVAGATWANTARFDMLTDEQKETLKGKEIGDAINDLRRQLLK